MKNNDTTCSINSTSYKEVKPWDEKTILWYKLSKNYHKLKYKKVLAIENKDFEEAARLRKLEKELEQLLKMK